MEACHLLGGGLTACTSPLPPQHKSCCMLKYEILIIRTRKVILTRTSRCFIWHVTTVINTVTNLGGENTARGAWAGVCVGTTDRRGFGRGCDEHGHQQGKVQRRWGHGTELATQKPPSHLQKSWLNVMSNRTAGDQLRNNLACIVSKTQQIFPTTTKKQKQTVINKYYCSRICSTKIFTFLLL